MQAMQTMQTIDAAVIIWHSRDMPTDRKYLFRVVLTPQRSASRRTRNMAVMMFAAACLPAGAGFAAIGAWPVAAFIGLDILLLAVFLHYHHFTGCMQESIELTRSSLIVERRDQWGRLKTWRFEPRWLRVHLRQPDGHRTRLELCVRDRCLSIGNFLSAGEKAGLARTLRHKLSRVSVVCGG